MMSRKKALSASVGAAFAVVAFVAAASADEVTPQIKGESPIAERFRGLTKSTNWELIGKIKLEFPTYHPQGMVKIGDFFYLSSVEITEPTEKFDQPTGRYDRTPGKGIAHLFKFRGDGELVSSVRLGEDTIYHPGGIDYDGRWLWVPVAEYRPNSSSIIYQVDLDTMQVREVFRVSDHIGGIVHNNADDTLHGVSWGSRSFYSWDLDDNLSSAAASTPSDTTRRNNGSHYVDYQDCHYLRTSYMLCGGVSWFKHPSGRFALGGLDLVDLSTQDAVHQVPVSLWVESGRPMTFNPFFVEVHKDNLRFYFAPEDDDTTVYIYDALN